MAPDYLWTESVLAIDCGSTLTQAVLIDRVGGEYRFIARGEAGSTLEPPWNDIMIAVRQAVQRLADVTGRRFLDEEGQLILPEQQTGGVDVAVVTTSAGEPLRLVLAGTTQDLSLASARRVIGMSAAVIDGLITTDRRDGSASSGSLGSGVQLIRDVLPDAIVVVGGMDGGARAPVLQSVQAAALAMAALPAGQAPPLIFAGNSELESRVAEVLGNETQLRVVDNVRPSPDVENLGPLQAEIDELYRVRQVENLPGSSALAAWTTIPILSTARAFARTVQYLARLDAVNVLGVDVGGAATTLASVVEDQSDLMIRSDLGLSRNAALILDHIPVESILRWLPFEIEPAEARNALHNKALHYRTLPQTRQDLLLEQAVAREIIRLALAELAPHWPPGQSRRYRDMLPRFELIVGAGGVLANAPHYGQAALILLDALQPVGICRMSLDRARLMAPLGAVAAVHPLAAAQVAARDTQLRLGTVVAPVGTAPEGEPALTLKVEYEDGRRLDLEVASGAFDVIPLAAGETANLELRPTRRFDVLRRGARGEPDRTPVPVEGGVLGIIVDARGRPLSAAPDPGQQRERVQRWLWELGS